jgi:uncharacterized membrane-anchored protein
MANGLFSLQKVGVEAGTLPAVSKAEDECLYQHATYSAQAIPEMDVPNLPKDIQPPATKRENDYI